MIKGLVMGRFEPLHKGHLGLIKFGISRCDSLTVLICSGNKDLIPGDIRLQWVVETYKLNRNVHPTLLRYNNTETKKAQTGDILEWSENIKRISPNNDILFSSEPYGDILASYLNCKHILYDQQRNICNISGSEIRENPKKFLPYIASVARKYYKL